MSLATLSFLLGVVSTSHRRDMSGARSSALSWSPVSLSFLLGVVPTSHRRDKSGTKVYEDSNMWTDNWCHLLWSGLSCSPAQLSDLMGVVPTSHRRDKSGAVYVMLLVTSLITASLSVLLGVVPTSHRRDKSGKEIYEDSILWTESW
mgnify:CR=1 FL=1